MAPRCPPFRAPRASHLPAVRGSSWECMRANGHGPTSAIAGRDGRSPNGRAQACTRERSRRIRPSGGAIGGCHASAAWMHACIVAHVAPACTDYASHSSSACLPCGAGAQLGADVGEAQRAGQSAGAYPANRVRSLSRCGCRRVQEVERVSDLRVARAWPEDGHCAPDCSRQRARRRAGSRRGGRVTTLRRRMSHPLLPP